MSTNRSGNMTVQAVSINTEIEVLGVLPFTMRILMECFDRMAKHWSFDRFIGGSRLHEQPDETDK